MAQDALSLSTLSSDAVQQVLGSAEAKAGLRLASCSRFLHAEAKRCQALWVGVLDHGERMGRWRVQVAAVKALRAAEAPALEAGSELHGRVGVAAVLVDLECDLHQTDEAKWQAGLGTAAGFKEVPEAQQPLLNWLGAYAEHLPGIECVEYAVGVMERFPQHELVQYNGCYALCNLGRHHPVLREPAGEVGAVEVLVFALNRFAESHQQYQHLRILCVDALRFLTDGLPLNAARLEAADGAHYLQA